MEFLLIYLESIYHQHLAYKILHHYSQKNLQFIQFYHIIPWDFLFYFKKNSYFFILIRMCNPTVRFLGEIHMLLEKSMKFFCNVLTFEAIALTLNYQFSTIFFEETPKLKHV